MMDDDWLVLKEFLRKACRIANTVHVFLLPSNIPHSSVVRFSWSKLWLSYSLEFPQCNGSISSLGVCSALVVCIASITLFLFLVPFLISGESTTCDISSLALHLIQECPHMRTVPSWTHVVKSHWGITLPRPRDIGYCCHCCQYPNHMQHKQLLLVLIAVKKVVNPSSLNEIWVRYHSIWERFLLWANARYFKMLTSSLYGAGKCINLKKRKENKQKC